MATELVHFACPVASGRQVALCGGANASVVYRFGRAGAVELEHPPSAQAGDPLRFAHYSRYQTERVEVRFGRQGAEYTVFDSLEGGRRRAGVRVTGADAKEREFVCTGRITGRLGDLQRWLPCDADSALNLGSCK